MSRRWSPSAFRPVGRTVHPPQPSPNHARRYTQRLPRLELQESEAQEVLLQTIHGHLARLISVFVLPMRLPKRTVAVQGDDFVRMGVTAAIRRSRRQLWAGRHPRNAAPHFAARASASTSAKAETGANVSFQANGLQASMIIFECAVCSRLRLAASMRGSSAELQALRMISTVSDGSQRVATAHVTSARSDGSTSSSTMTTSLAM